MNTNQDKSFAEILGITPERAKLVQGYLLLDYGRTSHLSQQQIKRDYKTIGPAIDADPKQAKWLAESYGL